MGGLEALERHRIVHERLRLCNIHLDLTGRVKICRFPFVGRGSHAYDSQTVLDESCHVDPDDTTCHQSNVQALGDLLCELVTCPNDAGMLSLSTLPSGYSKDFLDFVDETSRGELSALKQVRSSRSRRARGADGDSIVYWPDHGRLATFTPFSASR